MTRVAFLVGELGQSGGMAVIREYARHLREHEGMDCELVACAAGGVGAVTQDGDIPVRRLSEMADEPVDVAIATWWTTTESLWDLPAKRRAVLVQSLEQRYYRETEYPDRLGAEAVFDLPVHWLAVSEPLRRVLAAERPDTRTWLVRPGIDKGVFTPAAGERDAGALRVLVEGQPSVWFKGIQESIAAVRRMTEAATVTVVAPDPSEAGQLDADHVVGGLTAPEMAALYADHDVLLKLSLFEGLGLPVLEGFHVGLPCVVTPFGGAAELVEHGVNGLIVGFDDEPGTTAALDRLARDPALRQTLRAGALATAADWPDRAEAAATFGAAVRELADAEPPPVDIALRRLAHGRRRATEVQREALRREDLIMDGVRGEVAWWQAARDHELAKLTECAAKVGEYGEWVDELERRIAALQQRPGFRAEERMKRLLGRA